jgi:hypothetical protein
MSAESYLALVAALSIALAQSQRVGTQLLLRTHHRDVPMRTGSTASDRRSASMRRSASAALGRDRLSYLIGCRWDRPQL